MSRKLTCPGCGTHTSGVAAAFDRGEPCPHCGLPFAAADEVHAARRRNADADLTARYEAMVIRAGRAEAECGRLRETLDRVRDAIADSGDTGR